MKNLLKLMIILGLLIFIFFINNTFILLCLVIIITGIMLIYKINIKTFFEILLAISPFLLFTLIFDFFAEGLEYVLSMGVRLILIYMVSYVLINIMTTKDFVKSIELIFKPLKLLGINSKQITITVLMSISIIPYLLNEIQQKIYSIKSKSIKFNINSIIIIMKSILISIIIKVNKLDYILISRGYRN